MDKNCKFWTSKDLTQILYSGNILYNVIGKSTTLMVSELPQHIKLYNSIYKVEERSSVIGNIFQRNEEFQVLSFDQVEQFINSNEKCILIIGDSAISVQYVEKKNYIFDPHQRNSYGFPDSNGCAIVLKFNTFHKLYLYICELSKKLNTFNYELIPIEITRYKQIQIHHNKTETEIISNDKDTLINNKTKETNNNNTLGNIQDETDTNMKKEFAIKDKLNIENIEIRKRKIEHNTSYENISKRCKIEQELSNKKLIELQNSTINNINTTIQQENNEIIGKNKYETNSKNFVIVNMLKRKNEEHEDENIQQINKEKKYKEDKKSEIIEKNKETHDNPENFTNMQQIDKKEEISKKYLVVKIKDIMQTIHKKKNKEVLLKALEDRKKCKKYGYNVKVCSVKIKNINNKKKQKK